MKNIDWLIVEAGTSMFEILLFFLFFNGFLVRKDTRRIKEALVLLIAFGVHFAVGAVFFDVQYIMLACAILVSVFICFSLYAGSFLLRLFSPLLVVALMVVLELISSVLISAFAGTGIHNVNIFLPVKLIIVFVKNLLALTAIKVVTYNRKSAAISIKTGYFLMMLIVPAISIVLMYVIFDLVLASGKEEVSLAIMGFLCLMYVNIMIFVIFEGFMRQVNKEYRYMLMEKQLDMQLSHYEQLAESRSHIREIWHDFKNHIQCMRILYDKGDMKSLGEYIRNLSCYEERATVLDTGNPVIDALLSNKQSVAEHEGIHFDMELLIPPSISIPPADICTILGNSLDNAIEACCRIKNPDIEKRIFLSLTYNNGYLVMLLSNTFEEKPKKKGRQFVTWKSSPQFHGLGLQSIERTVGQYNGNMKIDIENDTFTLKILLPVGVSESEPAVG